MTILALTPVAPFTATPRARRNPTRPVPRRREIGRRRSREEAVEPSGEALLVKRLVEGDEAAFAQLLDQYNGQLLKLAMVFVSNASIAEEVVQETWLGVLRGLPKFQGRSSLKTWIFRILTNRAQTRGKREGRTVSFSSLGDDHEAFLEQRFQEHGAWLSPPATWNPEKTLRCKEARGVIEAALDKLPSNQRAVVILRDVFDTNFEEVCNILDVSETNQRVLLHRGRGRLRKTLEYYLDGV